MPPDPVKEETQEGFPGDPGGRPGAGVPDPERSEAPQDPLADLKKQVEKLERDNQDLRKQMRTKSAPEPPPVREEADPDWEKELFANPNATIKKIMELSGKAVEDRLRAEYQRDRGTTEFWNEFYRRHADLRDDHDLVEMTLKSHLSELSDLPVDKGHERLAELTRARIMRYIGAARGGRKASAEGAGPSSSKRAPKEPEEEKIRSISDILRERKRKRRGQAA